MYMNIKDFLQSIYKDSIHKHDIKKVDYLYLIATTAMLYTDDPDVINSCYLCDILVDRKLTPNRIKEMFGDAVLKLIQEVTPLQYIDDIMTPCKYKEHQMLYASRDALFVLLCVIYANIQTIQLEPKEDSDKYINCINDILSSLGKKRIIDNKCNSVSRSILQLLNSKYL